MGGKVLVLTLLTSLLSGLVVSNAYYKKKQFYPTVVYILNSNRSLGVLYLQAFLAVWVLCDLLKKLFFGTLRAAEVEHLIESLWYAVLETFILLAAFHQELNISFVTTVMTLFIVKSFHWLANDRVDFMERSPLISWVFHLRATSLLFCLLAVDTFFVRRSWISLTTRGPSVEIVFGLEYAIMLLSAVNTFAVYILHCINLYSENSWENKPIYMRYVDIVLGFFKLLLYVSYMMFMLYVLFIPLHIARRVYITAKNFQKSLLDLVNSRLAIRNLNTLCPDATDEELQEANLCAICREEMTSRCKKLPCNHIFHTSCLRGWFQSQQSCPTCRMDVLNRAVLTRMTRTHPRRNLQQNNGLGPHRVPPPAAGPGVGPGYPQAPPPPPHMMFPPQMMAPMWPGMMAPPPQPHPLNPQQPPAQQGGAQAGGEGEQPLGEEGGGVDQADGGVRDDELGQRQLGDGQSTANLQQQQPQPGGASGSTAQPPSGSTATSPPAGSTQQPQQHQQQHGAGSFFPPYPGTTPFMGGMPPPPFFPPMSPFGFMGAPHPMGVGMPSGDALRSLNDEELKSLEGMERANVEARIALLRDIQRLMDTAVAQLNQYSVVMATLSPTQPAGPGFPGYPNPPQPLRPSTSSQTNSDPTSLSSATGGGGGASSNSAAPPASQSSASTTTASPSSSYPSSSSSQDRTGLFQSQKSLPGGTSQPLQEPQGSFAFSARSLSVATSVDGEAHGESEQPLEEESTSPTSAHSASFRVGLEEDAKMMEIRQRRLQRFHSSPVSQPGRREDSASGGEASATTSSETGLTGSGTGSTGKTGISSDTSDSVET